jgi:hypothetical protein
MRVALENERCPFDADLERVLPGLHRRLHATHAETVGARAEIAGGRTDVNNRLNNIDNNLNNVGSRLNNIEKLLYDIRCPAESRQVGAYLANLANRMMLQDFPVNPTTSPTWPTPDNDQPIQRDRFGMGMNETAQGQLMYTGASRSSQRLAPMDSPEVHATYRLPCYPLALSEVWDMWFGTGKFADDYGGIHGRNKKHGSTWRKHLKQKQYSRLHQIIQGAIAYSKERNISPKEVLAEWEPLYDDCGQIISKLVSALQGLGKIKKAAIRGRCASARRIDGN